MILISCTNLRPDQQTFCQKKKRLMLIEINQQSLFFGENKHTNQLRIKVCFLMFIGWWSQSAELKFPCRILATIVVFSTRWTSRKQILTLYLHFIFYIILCINCEDSVLIVQNTRVEKLLNNVFGHNVELPSSWRRKSNVTLTNQDVCLSVTSLNDNVTWSIYLHRCMKESQWQL